MSLAACARILERGDPGRFRAAMAARPDARRVLFPVYAVNVEASRAPWMVSEPMLAEIRLQWWLDALEEIAAGATPRRHEVVTPLAEILDPEGARILSVAVAARRREIARAPFDGIGALEGHLEDLAGNLMWAAARALGATDAAAVRDVGFAGGLAGWLVAMPALWARDVPALPDPSDAGIRALAERGLSRIRPVSAAARPAALAASEARPVLARALRDPAAVREGRLERPAAIRTLRLMRLALRG